MKIQKILGILIILVMLVNVTMPVLAANEVENKESDVSTEETKTEETEETETEKIEEKKVENNTKVKILWVGLAFLTHKVLELNSTKK